MTTKHHSRRFVNARCVTVLCEDGGRLQTTITRSNRRAILAAVNLSGKDGLADTPSRTLFRADERAFAFTLYHLAASIAADATARGCFLSLDEGRC